MQRTPEAQVRTARAAHRTGTEWTINETNELAALRRSGLSVEEIARRTGRTYFAVSTRLSQVGLTTRRNSIVHAAPTIKVCPRCFLVHPLAVADCD